METSSEIERTAVSGIFRIVSRALVVAWAGFWAWFVIAVSLGEPPAPPLWIPAAWLTSLAALVVACWRWPVAGGALLAGAGIWAGAFFANPWARALLAAPAVVLGLVILAGALLHPRRLASR